MGASLSVGAMDACFSRGTQEVPPLDPPLSQPLLPTPGPLLAQPEPLLSQPEPRVRDRRAAIHACFFAIGAGSTVTFSTLMMSISYFREILGDGVLAKLALAHNGALIVTMGSLILVPRSPGLGTHLRAIRGSFLLAAALNVLVLHAAVSKHPLPASLLLTCVALNGSAAGLAQGLGASLGGLFDPISFVRGCGCMQLSGAAFGVLVPTITQLVLLPITARSGNAPGPELAANAARYGVIASTTVAALVAAAGLLGINLLSSTRIFAEVDATCRADPSLPPRPPAGSLACQNGEVLTLGQCVAIGSGALIYTRMMQLRAVMAAQFVNEFTFVAMVLTAAAIPSRGSEFMRASLPQILLVAVNICGFAGRIAATAAALGEPPAAKVLGQHVRALLLSALVLCAPCFAGLAHFYGRKVGASALEPVGAEMVALVFALVSTLSGFTMVSLGQLSQRLCDHSRETPCELTAQLIWLSVNAGALGGTVLSLALASSPGGIFGTS